MTKERDAMNQAVLNFVFFLMPVLTSFQMSNHDATEYRHALKCLDDSNVVVSIADDGNTCVYHNKKIVLLVASGLRHGKEKNKGTVQFFVPSIGKYVRQQELLRDKNNKLYKETVFLIRPGMRAENLISLFGSPFKDIASGGVVLCWELENGQSIQIDKLRADSSSSPGTLNTCIRLCSTNQLDGEILKMFTIAHDANDRSAKHGFEKPNKLKEIDKANQPEKEKSNNQNESTDDSHLE